MNDFLPVWLASSVKWTVYVLWVHQQGEQDGVCLQRDSSACFLPWCYFLSSPCAKTHHQGEPGRRHQPRAPLGGEEKLPAALLQPPDIRGNASFDQLQPSHPTGNLEHAHCFQTE